MCMKLLSSLARFCDAVTAIKSIKPFEPEEEYFSPPFTIAEYHNPPVAYTFFTGEICDRATPFYSHSGVTAGSEDPAFQV